MKICAQCRSLFWHHNAECGYHNFFFFFFLKNIFHRMVQGTSIAAFVCDCFLLRKISS